MTESKALGFRIAARGLVVKDNQLLFVSNDGHYWYLPGGRLEGKESLRQCVEREVYEETGLVVKTGSLLHVLESFDSNDQLHKINFYFQTTHIEGQLSDEWCDADGGVVKFRRYIDLEEIKKHKTIVPRFLANGDWCSEKPLVSSVYQGFILTHGFEILETVVPV